MSLRSILLIQKASHKIQCIRYFTRFENSEVSLVRSGIAWESDKKLKFKNPAECTSSPSNNTMECLKNQFQKFAKPKDWKKNLWELDTSNPENNGLQNEDLILWMRPAAFSNFKKLYRKINHTDKNNLILSKDFEHGIPKGKYSLLIEYNFEVASFNGTKSIVISTLNVLGNKTPFLAVAYIAVGSICIIIGIFFSLAHMKYGKRLTDVISINRMTLYHEK